MNFRQHTTFNTHDTHYVRDGRHIIANGVDTRCDTIVNVLHQNIVPMGVSDVLRHLGDSYTYTDISYAMRRLADHGILVRVGGGMFRLIPRGRQVWGRILRRAQAA